MSRVALTRGLPRVAMAEAVLGFAPIVQAITPKRREAGANPAQSRYGYRRPATEVRSPTLGACTTFERKAGTADDPDRLTQPSPHAVTDPWARLLPFGRRTPLTASNPERPGARRARRALLAPLAIVFSLLLSACAGASSPAPTPTLTPTIAATASPVPATPTPAPAFPTTITDDEGTAVAVAAEPQKIISLTPAATETLFAIGAGSRVVAKVEDITPYPPAADSLPVVATYKGLDIEKIVALKADLVIAGGLGFTPPDAVAQLRKLGIPVIVLYATSIDSALAGIEKVGAAAGVEDAARTLTTDMRAEITRLSGLTASLAKPLTFYEIDATSDIYTVPADSLYAEMLKLAGADPITTDSSYKISLEKLVAANPAIILLGDSGYTKPGDLAGRPGWSGIKAVVDGKIFPVDDTLITRPGPRLVDGLKALIAALHPEVKL